MNERISSLRNKMAGLNIQGMVILNPINIKYLTGIEAEGIFLITRKENIYITDSRYIEYVNSVITPFDEIVIDNFKNISLDDYENFFMFCENVGFEENYITYAQYKEFIHKYKINNFVEANIILDGLRMIKDENEIESIKKACKVTDNCFEFLLEYIKPGMTEKQIARKIEEYFNIHAEGIAFDTIVASGENSSRPHAMPGDRQILDKDIITIDMGCKIDGYCSDMTRTIFIGEPTAYQKEIYDLVLKNQENVLTQIKDNASIKQISKSVESGFEIRGYNLIHSLGHGVGLEIHEKPIINSKTDKNLKDRMVITDEPGIYIEGNFGIRIEDTVLVTKQGAELLTEAKKECIILKVL